MNQSRRTLPAVLLIALLLTPSLRADVKLPSVFSDHAVLQQGVKVPVWGWADPGEKVSVTVGDQKATAEADGKGRWKVSVGPLKAGGPVTLEVRGKNRVTVRDVLVGEVWLCSGQSNMAMTVSRAKDFEEEREAAKFPRIRMFKVANRPARTPQEQVPGSWAVCSPETVGGFSAAAYFFGRELHRKLGVPVGLINSSVGGTAIEAWTSAEVQKGKTALKPIFAEWDKRARAYQPERAQVQYQRRLAAWKAAAEKARKEGKRPPRRPRPPVDPREDRNHPANLFNGMIAPLVPYAIRGAIWYQGEHNARTVETAARYSHQLPLLIEDWRSRWGEGDFPFLWVQLPNFKARMDYPGATSAWAVMRESMLHSLKVPNTGMAVTIDVGEAGNIHPKDKQSVGRRLALAALAGVYGKDVVGSGPLYKGHEVRGNEVVVSFTHTGGKLVSKTDAGPRGFAIADAAGKWRWAQARIDGDKVVVWHPEVKKPVAVRYAWGDNPLATLYNAAGLPASPFRTDAGK
jgi:sialate O-acetylesterase